MITKNWKATLVVAIIISSVTLFYGCQHTTNFARPKPFNTQSVFFLERRKPFDMQSVFFLETSGKGTLNLRQLASVESAARFIPNSIVKVFVFTDENFTTNAYMSSLEEGYGVQFIRTSKKDFIANTPLEPWYNKGDWKKSPYVVSHSSDALRFLTLWKYGGIYFDLDVFLLREWHADPNLVVFENEDAFSSAILSFSKNHPVLLNCINWLNLKYDPYKWAINGPLLITKMVKDYLKDGHHKNNITMLPIHTFNAIGYPEFKIFFDPSRSEEVQMRINNSFGVHMWNKLSAAVPLDKNSNDAYHQILRKSSPIIYAAIQST